MNRISERERQVLAMAESGHTDESIAKELNISISTVRGYWLRVRTKLGGSSRAELVGQWVHLGSKAEGDRVAQEHQDLARNQLEDFQRLLADERSAMDDVFNDASSVQLGLIRDIRKDSDLAIQSAHEDNVTRSQGEQLDQS